MGVEPISAGSAHGTRSKVRRYAAFMPTTHLVPEDLRDTYEVHEYRSAAAILSQGFPTEWGDIVTFLRAFKLPKSAIVNPGGNKTGMSKQVELWFRERGWQEKSTKVRRLVDDVETASETHRIDCYKERIGFEWEWNSKDSVFSRDLSAFRLLNESGALDAGVIVTRADELQALFDSLGNLPDGSRIGAKYGASTTHLGKLLPRIERGEGGGCPLLVFGITTKRFDPDA